MSNLLEQASLVMIPSGYKEDVVYSEIPLNGAGDLTFTRASNGTRINSAGLVEVVPWNLLQYSEDFSNAAWVKSGGATITANDTTAPNGTLTADKINLAANIYSGAYQLISQPIGIYANSIYAKAGTFNYLFVLINGSSGYYVWFNLTTGTVGSKGSNMDGIIESVGNGWYRCTATRNLNTDTNDYHQFGFSDAENFTPTTTGNAYVWGAQANIGSTAKPYFPTTDRLNVPRLTYQNGGGGCPSLLLEKQSTNLFTYSEQFDNGAWIKNNITITANAITSPDGTQNADKIADSINTASAFYFYQSVATSGTQYTSSGYFKKGEYNFVTLHAFGLNGAVFNLNTGVLVSQSGGTGTITSVGNGWYRCTFTFTAGGSAVFFSQSPAGNISYTGTIGSGIYAWGLQCEASSYATSYIPTTASSATRVADSAVKTGISSLIGQTEGVIYCDVYLDVRQTFSYLAIAPNIGVANIYIGIGFNATSIQYEVVNSGIQSQITFVNSSTGRFKIAAAYKQNDFVLYVNGTQIGTDTSGTVPTCSEIGLFAYNQNQPLKYNQIAIFKTRLINAELASLTTL